MDEVNAGSLTGRTLGSYRLAELLGVGGMAEVYRGEDLHLRRAVAVKVLTPSQARGTDFARRFREEARRVAALDHPNIVPVYYFDEQDGLLYLVMPLLDESLRRRMERFAPLQIAEVARIVGQIAAALDAAHAQGIVHRDVKPENILLNAEGDALLSDFGIAREVQPDAASLRPSQTLSAIGLPIGTPEFMAPEQLRMAAVDSRADIYALGAVLYELLTGHTPHEAATPLEVAALTLSAPVMPPSMHNPTIWPALDDVALMALAYEPGDRFSDARHFAGALRDAMEARDDAPPLPSTWRRTAGGTSPTLPDGLAGIDANTVGAAYAGGGRLSRGSARGSGRFRASSVAPDGAWPLARAERWRIRGVFVVLLILALLTVVCGGTLLITRGLLGSAPEAGAPTVTRNIAGTGTTQGLTGTPGATSLAGSPGTTGVPQVPGGAVTATPTGTMVGTPAPTSSPTFTPTPTSTPVPMLALNPAPPAQVLLTQRVGSWCITSGSGPSQTISNVTSQASSWSENGFPANTYWSLNGNSWQGGQPSDSALAGGTSDSLNFAVPCSQPPVDFTVNALLTDGVGRTYPFVVHVKVG